MCIRDRDRDKPLDPAEINVIMPDYFNSIKGYQGFEAICFIGNKAYLIIETKDDIERFAMMPIDSIF